MVHSFAYDTAGPATDLIKTPDRRIYAAAGFTALADHQPLVKAAKARYPEMGSDKDDFLRFFRVFVDIENYCDDVDERVAEAIKTARSLKVGDTEVFDRIQLRQNDDGDELLAYATTRFGLNTLYFPIVQWRTTGDTDEHTSIEEIKALHRDIEQAKKDREQAEQTKKLRTQRLLDVLSVGFIVPAFLAILSAAIFTSPVMLFISLFGTIPAILAAAPNAIARNSRYGQVGLALVLVNMLSVILCLSYLTHMGVIK